MDIPSPSPSAPLSHHSPPSTPSTAAGSSFAPPNWSQRLSQRLDTMSLDVQQMHHDHQEDMHKQDCRLGVTESQQVEILGS